MVVLVGQTGCMLMVAALPDVGDEADVEGLGDAAIAGLEGDHVVGLAEGCDSCRGTRTAEGRVVGMVVEADTMEGQPGKNTRVGVGCSSVRGNLGQVPDEPKRHVHGRMVVEVADWPRHQSKLAPSDLCLCLPPPLDRGIDRRMSMEVVCRRIPVDARTHRPLEEACMPSAGYLVVGALVEGLRTFDRVGLVEVLSTRKDCESGIAAFGISEPRECHIELAAEASILVRTVFDDLEYVVGERGDIQKKRMACEVTEQSRGPVQDRSAAGSHEALEAEAGHQASTRSTWSCPYSRTW